MTWEIENTRSGVVLGRYPGATADEALDAMAREAGYSSYADLQAQVPAAPGEIVVRPERETNDMTYYTTWGPVRGDCGHRHRTAAAAERCRTRDERGCARQGGYSDRQIRRVADAAELRTYDVTHGPGRPVAVWETEHEH